MIDTSDTVLDQSRYTLLDPLGSGGMGTVYKAEDTQEGRHVALKLMTNWSPAALLRFKQEFRVVADLDHPNLVELFELGNTDSTWFYTMALVEGKDLLAVLGTSTLSMNTPVVQTLSAFELNTVEMPSQDLQDALEATREEHTPPGDAKPCQCDIGALCDIMRQVTDALIYLHERGIIHRDLKPSNIMVTHDGIAKVLDFGLVKLEEEELATMPGGLIGTLAFMSPEQVEGGEITPSADLYGLGCTLFRALTGQLPFEGSLLTIAEAHRTRTPPSVDSLVTGVPSDLVDLVRGLMSKRPEHRPSLREVRSVLGGTASSYMRALKPHKTPAFVGRAAELSWLKEHFEAASSGEFAGAFLVGESGQGKSALARHFVKMLGENGEQAFYGQCYEREAIPFRAFDHLIDKLAIKLVHDKGTPGFKRMVAKIRKGARLFPALRLAMPTRGFQIYTEDEPDIVRHEAFVSLSDTLALMAEKTPLAIVLDDFHWADPDSGDLLRTILARAPKRVMLLVVARPDITKPDHPLDGLLDALPTLELGPLAPEEIGALLRDVTQSNVISRPLHKAASKADGNPFLAMQVGQLFNQMAPLPEETQLNIETIVGQRFASLSRPAILLLNLSAVASGALERRLLIKASGLTETDFQEACAELISDGFLRISPDVEAPLCELSHNTFREVAFDQLVPTQLNELHRALAEAIEHFEVDVPDALYTHWIGAGDPTKAAQYRWRAAQMAEEQLAPERAMRLYLETSTDPVVDEAHRFEAHLKLAVMALGSGDATRGRQHIAPLIALFEQSSPDNPLPAPYDTPRRAEIALQRWRTRLATLLFCAGDLEGGLQHSEPVSKWLGHPLDADRPRGATALLALKLRLFFLLLLPGGWLRRDADDADDIKASFYAAVTILLGTALGHKDIRTEYRLRHTLLLRRLKPTKALSDSIAKEAFLGALNSRGRRNAHEKSLELAKEALSLARQGDNATIKGRALVFSGAARCLSGQWSAAAECFDEALPDLVNTGVQGVWLFKLAGLLTWHILGRDEDVLTFTDNVSDEPELATFSACALNRVRALLRSNRPLDVSPLLEQWSERLGDQPPNFFRFQHALATLTHHLTLNKIDAAFAHIASSEVTYGPMGYLALHGPGTQWHSMAIEALAISKRRGNATAELPKATLDRAKVLSDMEMAPMFGPALLRSMALLDFAEGQTDKARSTIKRALDQSKGLDFAHQRQLVLTAARHVDLWDDTLAAELTRLEETWGFTDPFLT